MTQNSKPFRPSCRLLIEPQPQRGSWNMAVDEVLLEAAVERQIGTLRLYRWSEATLSLGYFQPADGHGGSLAGLPVVRRLSGGGAILHHRELTYSLALPASHPLAATPSALYGTVHRALMAVLAEHGVQVALRGAPRAGDEPFLCFGRGDANDLVLGPHKVVGSAQRRRRGAVLQHGSILLRRSEHAPDFPGLADLSGVECDEAALAVELAEAIVAALEQTGSSATLAADEQQRAVALERERYCQLDWGRPRTSVRQ